MKSASHDPRHRNGERDRRYTIKLEYCGYLKPQWVVRFCGDWVGRAPQRPGATDIALAHQADRLRAMAITSTAT